MTEQEIKDFKRRQTRYEELMGKYGALQVELDNLKAGKNIDINKIPFAKSAVMAALLPALTEQLEELRAMIEEV